MHSKDNYILRKIFINHALNTRITSRLHGISLIPAKQFFVGLTYSQGKLLFLNGTKYENSEWIERELPGEVKINKCFGYFLYMFACEE